MHKHLPSVFGDNTFPRSANICHLGFSPPEGHSRQKGEWREGEWREAAGGGPQGAGPAEEGPIILVLCH